MHVKSQILIQTSGALIVFFLFLMAPPAQAQNNITFKAEPSVPLLEEFKPLLQVKLNQVSYISESLYDHTHQQQVEVQLGHVQTGFIFSESRVVIGTFTEPKSFYFAAPQFYVGFGDQKQSFMAVGRLKKNFNFLDSFYNLGLYNSYFSNDFIDYKEQGLTGLHFQLSNGFVGAYVGIDPYFLPNQEPQVHEDAGTLVSSNRWAQRPPPQFQFAQQNRKIEYAIRDYKLNEIIENPGQVASFFIGGHDQRPFFQLSYANHPLNEIPLTRDTYGSANDFVGHVNLSPVVTYHEVGSADLNLDFEPVQLTLSYAEDKVRNKTASESETLQHLNPLKVYGASISANLKNWADRVLILSLCTAEFKGGEIIDLTQDGKESIFTFSSARTRFRSPTTLGLSTELFLFNSHPLKSQLRWTYDRTYKGTLASLNFSIETLNHVELNVGADVIGVEQKLPANTDANSNFLDRNQANDRVYGGLQYDF